LFHNVSRDAKPAIKALNIRSMIAPAPLRCRAEMSKTLRFGLLCALMKVWKMGISCPAS
jgi:hypothetical protein